MDAARESERRLVPLDHAQSEILPGGTELKVPFTKIQTIGNDFVLIAPGLVEPSGFAKAVCDRRFGIGGDGLLVISRGTEADIDLRMFNPDGSEDFCGNGLRCAGHFARVQGWVGESFTIHHLDRVVSGRAEGDQISITLPAADFSAKAVPVSTELPEFLNQMVKGVEGTALSTGSAHFVAFVDELPDDEAFFRLSSAIETDPLFPERISAMWTKVVSTKWLKLRIWERGAGETMGCGTGSSAAAAAWARRSGESGTITVENPGGELEIQLNDWKSPIQATSEPEITYSGVYDFD